MTDVRDWDRRALEVTDQIVARVRSHHLDLPSPCADWTVRRLLEHMIGLNHGFAGAAEGLHTTASDWADHPFDDTPAATFTASAHRATTAFATVDLDQPLWLPLVRGGGTYPASVAIGFHFVDSVVHAWDVAAALGGRPEFTPELLSAVQPYVNEVPDGPNRRQPEATFQPAVPTDSGDHLDQILALLGRDPRWPGDE
ncbi:TIGR03086 family metal-binding protein [Actinokineospora inagensis]|uniref:TIGR03086 family metal-binding protein n=1 Tax=Actinokineospora inagensis TaxID=103730 RepID=UPI000402C868|nr:TIGR03086 family metal-binding protein [Actinokineospora inagensis]